MLNIIFIFILMTTMNFQDVVQVALFEMPRSGGSRQRNMRIIEKTIELIKAELCD